MGKGGGDGLVVVGEGDACPVERVTKGRRKGGREGGEGGKTFGIKIDRCVNR